MLDPRFYLGEWDFEEKSPEKTRVSPKRLPVTVNRLPCGCLLYLVDFRTRRTARPRGRGRL